MADTKVLMDEAFFISERYRIILKVYEVKKSKKYPEGIKAKYVLIDVEGNFPRLLVDNHEPFGFHLHTHLPENKNIRVKLDTDKYLEALEEFRKDVTKIIEEGY